MRREPCRLHEELIKFNDFVTWVRDHNLYNKNEVISKIAFFLKKRIVVDMNFFGGVI